MFRTAIVHLAFFATATAASEILSAEQAFNDWTQKHNKLYASNEERNGRFEVWKENDVRIQQHNNQIPAPTFTLGHNPYSDMTEAEFAEFFSLKSVKHDPKPSATVSVDRRALLEQNVNLPDYVNWIANGAVTPVKNQGACGSCWAFSTTGALEGAKFIKTGELVALSEQNLLDCDHTDMGCSGGLMDNAFKFDEKSGGLCSEDDYPYVARQHKTCATNCTDVPGSSVETFVDVPHGDEKALVAALAMQPISVAIEASQFVFQFYKNGVITDDSCGSRGNIDHGVLAVGYGTDLETNAPYFLVKNSWGAEWGENGYVKIGRGGKNKLGICAILAMASFPVVA